MFLKLKYDNRNGKRRKFDKRSLCRVWLRNKWAYSKSVQYSLFESEWLPHSNNIILDRTRSTISLLWGVLLCSYIPQEKSGKMTNITSLWRHIIAPQCRNSRFSVLMNRLNSVKFQNISFLSLNCYRFCDFTSKMTIWAKNESFEVSRNST